LKFLFDNNLPPSLARGVAELSRFDPAIEHVMPLRDKFPQDAPDTEWLGQLLEEGGWTQAAQLFLWWPKIIDVAKLTSKTALRVPWRFTSNSTFEQIRG
jgi:hypothetical protein